MSKELKVVNDNDEIEVLDADELSGTGLQNVDESDLMVPRLQIATGTSKQIMKGNEKFIPGLSVGEIFNTVTKEVYGDDVTVIPVWFSKNRILFDIDWKIECSSPDGVSGGSISPRCDNCEYSQWGSGENDKGFKCTEFRNFAVLIVTPEGASTLASVSLKSTSSGVAKNWLNMISARTVRTEDNPAADLPMYRGLYTLATAAKENTAKGAVFYVWSINNAGKIDTRTKEGVALAAKAKAAHQRFKKLELSMAGQGNAE